MTVTPDMLERPISEVSLGDVTSVVAALVERVSEPVASAQFFSPTSAVVGSQKFAVLLCKFSDNATFEPHPTSYYQDLVERSGTGGLADYWAAASLNHIDLIGSKVFDWRTLTVTKGAFLSAHPGRWDKVQAAIGAFPEMRAADYTGVIVVFNDDLGDSGAAGNGVLCQKGDTNVSFLAHETGHVLGLQHSFECQDVRTPTGPRLVSTGTCTTLCPR